MEFREHSAVLTAVTMQVGDGARDLRLIPQEAARGDARFLKSA